MKFAMYFHHVVARHFLQGSVFVADSLKASLMSQAFVRESEEQWLHEVPPTINALIVYLTRENNGIRVYEKKSYIDDKTGKEIYEMSNGLKYSKDNESRWYVI